MCALGALLAAGPQGAKAAPDPEKEAMKRDIK
jgi:hypothetical protein